MLTSLEKIPSTSEWCHVDFRHTLKILREKKNTAKNTYLGFDTASQDTHSSLLR